MDVLTSYLLVTFDIYRSMTEKDELLQSMKEFIKSGWPDLRLLRQHPDCSQLKGFWRRRESLKIERGCVLFRESVVIPNVLRTKVLKLLHQGHPEM